MSTALSSTVPASSRALARVQSRVVDDGSDEDRSRIRNVWARVGDSHERVDSQDVDAQTSGAARGNESQCRVAIQNRFNALRADRDAQVPPTIVDALEEDLVASTRSTLPASTGAQLDAGGEEPRVATGDTTSSIVPASARVMRQFSRNVVPRVREHNEDVRPTQWEADAEPEVGSGVLDELQRDLEGPEVFPMTDDAEVEVAPVPRRRQSRKLVLVPHRARSPEFEGSTPRQGSGTRDDEARDDEARQLSDSDDTVSLPDDGSVVSGAEEYIAPSEPDPTVAVAEGLTPPIRAALVRLDEVDLEEFQRRGAVMKTVPHFLRGPYRSAMRLAMGEALQDSEQRRESGSCSLCSQDCCSTGLAEGGMSTKRS